MRRTRYGTLKGKHQMDKQLYARRKSKSKLTFELLSDFPDIKNPLNKKEQKASCSRGSIASFNSQTSQVAKDINSLIFCIQ